MNLHHISSIALILAVAAAHAEGFFASGPSRLSRPFRALSFLRMTSSTSSSSTTTAADATTAPAAVASKPPAVATAALTQEDYKAKLNPGTKIQSSHVAVLPRPGTSVPSSIRFHTTKATATAGQTWITYLAPPTPEEAAPPESLLTNQLWAIKVDDGTTTATTAASNTPIQLFQPGKAGTEDDYSLEEKLRRERARMMSTGVTSYQWADTKMLIPLGGALWILDNPLLDTTAESTAESTAVPRKLVETNTNDPSSVLPLNAPLLDAKLSADGSMVAFVADKEVYCVSSNTNVSSSLSSDAVQQPTQITFGARNIDGRTNGVADYVAQEELERSDGFWLSPNGTRLAYEQVDEAHIPSYRIVHQGEPLAPATTADGTKAAPVTFEEHRYPFAGAENPIVKLGVVGTTKTSATTTGDPIWFDLAKVFGSDFYLAKVEWLKTNDNHDDDTSPADDDSTKLVVQLLDRRQHKLALVLLDVLTGEITTLHTEIAMEGAWINLNDVFRVVSTDGDSMTFLWASERDGYRHLYLQKASLTNDNASDGGSAQVVRRLTGPGEFIVEEVLDVHADYVYFMGTSPNQWLEKHLFRVSLQKEEEPTCLTADAVGQHSCVLDLKSGMFVDTLSCIDQPPTVTIRKLSDPSVAVSQIFDAAEADARVAALGDSLIKPTFHQLPSTDGTVTLQAALYKPSSGEGPWPLVVATYGGPHVQYVQNTWGMMVADMRTQFLVSNGFAVLKVDNRGSNRRGLVFESPIQGNMGDLEVADQVAGVEWAVQEGVADPARIAVSGWSYGGYMALKCITDRPDVFHAAISGAPVTDWALYDTAYTERYMGLPQENPEGYKKSSALHNVGNLQGSLMLCHGLLDENVLFRHSAVLVNELIAHQKAYELCLFPSERHGPRRPQDRAFLEERILAFLQRSLVV